MLYFDSSLGSIYAANGGQQELDGRLDNEATLVWLVWDRTSQIVCILAYSVSPISVLMLVPFIIHMSEL